MSGSQRAVLSRVLACAIMTMNLGWRGPWAHAAAGAQPPSPSAENTKKRFEDEMKRADAEWQRMNPPEVRQERALLIDLSDAVEGCYWRKDAGARADCESLLAKTLALPKPSARVYSACAMVASTLDRPKQAIEIVKKGIAEYPEESISGFAVPLKIAGYYRIGALATRAGDVNEARRAYESAIVNSRELKGKEYLTALCHMCLADLARHTPGQEQIAAAQWQQVVTAMESVSREARDHDDLQAIDLMKNWAQYELTRLQHGGPASNAAANPGEGSLMLVVVGTSVSCPSLPEMEQMMESEHPSILRDLAALALVTNCLLASNPFQAEKYLLRVAASDSYFQVRAQDVLASVREQMKKIREKIPAMVKDLKEGDANQREQAARKLLHEAGSEGMRALQEAQNDPNKYVRYTAACTLANHAVGRSVPGGFDIILEALSDGDPNVRRKAGDALGFRTDIRPCLKIGPKEIMTVIRLMKEHYSAELAETVKELLFSAKAEPGLVDLAVAELAPLIGPADKDTLNNILDIFARTKTPPVKAADALMQRLVREQDEEMQQGLVEMLGWIGPPAQSAVPMLIKYTQHKDPNIRYIARRALERISPTEAAKIPKTPGEP